MGGYWCNFNFFLYLVIINFYIEYFYWDSYVFFLYVKILRLFYMCIIEFLECDMDDGFVN